MCTMVGGLACHEIVCMHDGSRKHLQTKKKQRLRILSITVNYYSIGLIPDPKLTINRLQFMGERVGVNPGF